MKRTSRWIICILLFVLVGYFREFFFFNLNVILYHKWYHTPYVRPLHPMMTNFETLSYNGIYWMKYLFTAMFVAIFFGLNYISLRLLSARVILRRFLMWIYAAAVIISVISMLYGYAVHSRLNDDEYTLSRWLMGIAQSPIICLILLASEKLYQPSTDKT